MLALVFSIQCYEVSGEDLGTLDNMVCCIVAKASHNIFHILVLIYLADNLLYCIFISVRINLSIIFHNLSMPSITVL